jgi:hypothetical protein
MTSLSIGTSLSIAGGFDNKLSAAAAVEMDDERRTDEI